MNKEMLIKLIASIRKNIESCEDEAELKKLENELMEAIEAKATIEVEERLRKEAAEKEKTNKAAEDEETQKAVNEKRDSMKGTHIPDGANLKVGTPALYKGYNLKQAIDVFQHDGRVNKVFQAKARADESSAEKVCKWMVDVMANAKIGTVKAMNEGTTTAGGHLTETEERMAVLSYIRDVSIAMGDCQHIPMQSDSMTMPRENGNVSVAFTSEASNATATSAVFDQVTLTAKRLDAYVDVSNELINDAGTPGGIAGLLAGQFLEAVGQKIDSAVFIGTGDPMSGVFKYTGADSEVFSAGSSHFSELLESNIRNVIPNVRANRRKNAKFYMSDSVLYQYVYGLKDSDGRNLFVELINGNGPTGKLWGYPVQVGNDDIMPSTSAASTGFITFGDLAGVLIGDRLTNISLMEDPYSLSASYQTRFLLFTRWAFAHGLPKNYSRIVTAS